MGEIVELSGAGKVSGLSEKEIIETIATSGWWISVQRVHAMSPMLMITLPIRHLVDIGNLKGMSKVDLINAVAHNERLIRNFQVAAPIRVMPTPKGG